MELEVTVRHDIPVDDDEREMMRTKVERLSRFSRHIVSGHVILEEDGSGLLLELNVTAKGKVLTAKSKGFDLTDTVEETVEKMARQLRRYESRFKDRKKEPGIRRQDGEGEEEEYR